MDKASGQVAADEQIAKATAAEQESLSLECRADPAWLERLLAPDFHEFDASGGEIGYEGTAERVAVATHPHGEPISVENLPHWGTSLNRLQMASPAGVRTGETSGCQRMS